MRHAWQRAPLDAAVFRLGAEIEDAQDLPDAPSWWARVVELEPGSSDALFSWAKSALRLGQFQVAGRALDSTPPAARQTAAYHELMAGIALAAHHRDAADAQFAEAARLEPANPMHRINRASLRLEADDTTIQSTARVELESAVGDDAPSRLPALRALLGDALRRHDRQRITDWRARLLAVPQRSWNDDILCLSATLDEAAFNSVLTDLEKRAEGHLADLVTLADWLTAHDRAGETRRWLGTIPGPIRGETRVQICFMNSLTVLGDWKTLQEALTAGPWRQLDFLRRATLVRVARELGEPDSAAWHDLVQSLDGQPQVLLLLAETVQAWGWEDRSEAVFWTVADQDPLARRGALRSLWQHYSATGNTPGLLRVARRQYTDAPDDPLARNNYAFLSMLLHGSSELADRLSREVAAVPGAAPEFLATRAFALHCAGKAAEAVQVLEALPAEVRQSPGVALYYGLALEGAGQRKEAVEFAGLAARARLLPEEKRLLEDLQVRLAGR